MFGLASVRRTHGFVAGLDVPLWPSFVASATVYAVDPAGASAFGVGGLAGATLAAAVGMAIGALIGVGTAELSDRLA